MFQNFIIQTTRKLNSIMNASLSIFYVFVHIIHIYFNTVVF